MHIFQSGHGLWLIQVAVTVGNLLDAQMFKLWEAMGWWDLWLKYLNVVHFIVATESCGETLRLPNVNWESGHGWQMYRDWFTSKYAEGDENFLCDMRDVS